MKQLSIKIQVKKVCLEMTLKNRGVCNVANVCWQRVPDGQTMHDAIDSALEVK